MKLLGRIFLGVFVLPAVASCATTGKHSNATSLCTLASNGAKFDHTIVSFNAVIESDGIEHTALTDNACPGKGIALSITDKAAMQPTVKNLVDAIFRQGRIGTVGKHITATVSGLFLFTPEKIPRRTLVLESVSNLSVSKVSEPKSSHP